MKWLRRIGCIGLVMLWLCIMLLPFAMFRLARNEQIQVRHTRIFQVQEADYQGVGFHTTHPARNETACDLIRVRYVLWEGETDDVSRCYCTDQVERVPAGWRTCAINP